MNPLNANDIDIFSIRCRRAPHTHYDRPLYDFRLKEKPLSLSRPDTRYNCVVKVSYTSSAKTAAHIRYIMREGAGIDGEKPTLFDDTGVTFKTAAAYSKNRFLKGEKRIFKFVISPEKTAMDLSAFTQRVMRGIEIKQGQKLNWAAAVHGNTANPHVHVVVRGIDKNGAEVRLKKELIRNGIRNICKEDIALNYGEKSFFQARLDELKLTRSRNVTKFDRAVDRKLQTAARSRFGYIPYIPASAQEYERLSYLSQIGLAKKTFVSACNFAQKGFLVDCEFLTKLQTHQKANDIVKTYYRDRGKTEPTPAAPSAVKPPAPQPQRKNAFARRNKQKLRMMV